VTQIDTTLKNQYLGLHKKITMNKLMSEGHIMTFSTFTYATSCVCSWCVRQSFFLFLLYF
jgi:hypothetical protein